MEFSFPHPGLYLSEFISIYSPPFAHEGPLLNSQAFGLLICSFILARRVVNGEMDVGDYVTFVSYLGQLYSPLNRIASLYKTVMQNL